MDRTEDLDTGIEENPTRDTLAEGLLCLVRPTIDSLEQQVSSTLTAQVTHDINDIFGFVRSSFWLRSLELFLSSVLDGV